MSNKRTHAIFQQEKGHYAHLADIEIQQQKPKIVKSAAENRHWFEPEKYDRGTVQEGRYKP